ncbi:MAG: short-chain dehydrogenase [Actinobacteria bacterium 13_2_20CM_2_71_6]|nr:MAG: short-chain dehydrogenase [Actinobacteria bacterium 13_2_20CM_2_71_6]
MTEILTTAGRRAAVPTALITGASRGLGRALARTLAERGATLVLDARHAADLDAVAGELAARTEVVAIAGDVSDPAHRRALAAAVARLGGLDLLVNNASTLGPSPQPAIADYPLSEFSRVYEVNVLAPVALIQLLLPSLTSPSGRIVNISSDAAVEPYPGWGGYGSAKAALDQVSAVLGAERPDLHVYAFDPGDMRTDMHQQAFPGEDISDRPEPETVVPALLRLIDGDLPSGRYRGADLAVAV